MSTDKKMTPKMFLFKSGTKAANSALAFLQTHRDFLVTGELASVTSPILAKIDAGQTMPTPGLEEIRAAVLSHHLLVECQKAEAKLLASNDPSSHGETSSRTSKTWEVTCYDSRGNICTRVNTKGETVDISESFPLQQRASEWADRRLVHNCASDCFATITHIPSGLEAVIMRGNAMARLFKAPTPGVFKKLGKGDGKLSFGVKAHQSRATFSHG